MGWERGERRKYVCTIDAAVAGAAALKKIKGTRVMFVNFVTVLCI